jgi:hypothetical protein
MDIIFISHLIKHNVIIWLHLNLKFSNHDYKGLFIISLLLLHDNYLIWWSM